MTKLFTILIMCSLTFVPAPIIQPGIPFMWEFSQCPSEPIAAIVVRTNVTYHGELGVYDKDGDDVTFVTNRIVVDPNYISEVADPNNPQWLKRTYKYTYLATTDGLYYENVAVSDQYEAGQPRTIIFLSVANSPPVITGCR